MNGWVVYTPNVCVYLLARYLYCYSYWHSHPTQVVAASILPNALMHPINQRNHPILTQSNQVDAHEPLKINGWWASPKTHETRRPLPHLRTASWPHGPLPAIPEPLRPPPPPLAAQNCSSNPYLQSPASHPLAHSTPLPDTAEASYRACHSLK